MTGRGRVLAVPTALATLVAVPLSIEVAATPARADDATSTSVACPWMDTSKTADQRAQLLLAASTLDQKLRWLDEQAANSPDSTTFGGVAYPVQVPCTPTVVYTDGPDYVRGSAGVTVFPAQIALAASWNGNLAYTKGKTQADEAFKSGKNVILGPGMSSSRTPLAGRVPEYLSEDSLLSGNLAAADVDGIQHGNPDEPVLAVLKHYIANEQELDRQTSNSVIDDRTLHEVYDAPFRIAIDKSDPGGVMCSYNQVNGAYACENPLLNTLLKGEDGFQGYVTSDFGAVHSTVPSLVNGLDQELNRPKFYTPANIEAALAAGQVTEQQIDTAAFRVVRAYLAAGLFDHPLPATASTSSSTPEHKAVAEDIAEQGSVLLKNSGAVLPLTAASKTVAVIGQTASNTPTLVSGKNVSAGTVCAEGSPNAPFGGGNACPAPVAPLDAITARAAESGASVVYDNGNDTASAAAAAKKADVAVVFAYEKQGEFADRTSLSLDGNGDALISAVAAANPNTVVVLETGSAVAMPWLDSVKGVVEAWYPGDQQGTALAKLLYGDVNFMGKLPMTFPKSLADTPEQTPQQYPGIFGETGTTTPPNPRNGAIRQVTYSEGLAVGYKWYDSKGIAPLFPFGYGLSYTSYAYDNVHVNASNQHGAHALHVTFRVANTGAVAGTETAQVYLTLPGTTGEPGKRLVGYTQVSLQPGEHKQVQMDVNEATPDHPLSFYDTASHSWQVAPGAYSVQVGSSSRSVSPPATVTLS